MNTERDRQKQNQFHNSKNRRILLWLLILLLLILLSSCGLMYHLGMRAKDQAEPNKQTIKVEPEAETKTVLSIYGVVRYTDGTPCINHTVEMHSTPKTTQTGQDGSFFFYDVEYGDHQLSVLDQDGRERASVSLNISEHEDKTLQYVKVTDLNQQIRFEIPINTLLLDVNLELDDQKQLLSMDADAVTAALTEGRVLTSSASVQVKDGEAVVFASGHYMLQDGTIALANGGILFPHQEYLPPVAAGNAASLELPAGVTVDENGILHLEDQTQIDRTSQQITLPNGIILRPDQTASMPDDSILHIPDYGNNAYLIRETESGLIGDGTAGSKNVGIINETRTGNPDRSETMEDAENSGEMTSSKHTGNAGNTAGSGNVGGSGAYGNSGSSNGSGSLEVPGSSNSSGGPGNSISSGNSGGSGSSGDSGNTNPTEETGSVEIGDTKTGKLWKQMASINLFTDLSGKQVYETLYPGIEGRYDFYIRNTMKTITYMTVTVEEEANSKNGGTLPLEYKILDETGKEISGDWKDAAQLKAFSVTLQPNQNVNYSIRWRWPYERTDSTGSSQAADAYDTNLAVSAERSHKLKLVIHVEQ